MSKTLSNLYKDIYNAILLSWSVILLKIKVEIGGILALEPLSFKNKIRLRENLFIVMTTMLSNNLRKKHFKHIPNVKNANIVIRL